MKQPTMKHDPNTIRRGLETLQRRVDRALLMIEEKDTFANASSRREAISVNQWDWDRLRKIDELLEEAATEVHRLTTRRFMIKRGIDEPRDEIEKQLAKALEEEELRRTFRPAVVDFVEALAMGGTTNLA